MLEPGPRTIGGTAAGTLLVTPLVIAFVQDYEWSGLAARRAPLAEHNTANRETIQRPRGRGLSFQSACAIYYPCLDPVAPPPKWTGSQWMSPAPCGAGPRLRTSRSPTLPAN